MQGVYTRVWVQGITMQRYWCGISFLPTFWWSQLLNILKCEKSLFELGLDLESQSKVHKEVFWIPYLLDPNPNGKVLLMAIPCLDLSPPNLGPKSTLSGPYFFFFLLKIGPKLKDWFLTLRGNISRGSISLSWDSWDRFSRKLMSHMHHFSFVHVLNPS